VFSSTSAVLFGGRYLAAGFWRLAFGGWLLAAGFFIASLFHTALPTQHCPHSTAHTAAFYYSTESVRAPCRALLDVLQALSPYFLVARLLESAPFEAAP
jgi:hypothetical protein